LERRGDELVHVDAPDHFAKETLTAIMVRRRLGAVTQFEKLHRARERIRRSLRVIAKELPKLGRVAVSGKPYGAESVELMGLGK